MNILLTNDDGYNSEGILLMKKLLSKYGTVVIVAPDSPRSGYSAALTLRGPIQLEEVEKNVFKCSGTPVDCVSMGLCCLNVDFDLVVSGCNNGWNISYDTMYSGTIGATLEAMMFFKPAIAFSIYHHGYLDQVEKHFEEVWDYINKYKLISNEYILNINFPKDEVKGLSLSSLYYRKDQNYFTKEEDGYHAYRHCQTNFDDDKNSDCYHVEHGIISICPLSRTYFNKEIKVRLDEKIK